MYAESRSSVVAGTNWCAKVDPGLSLIAPDGCMDLLWNGRTVTVAGPDATAFRYETVQTERLLGLRFDPGVLPHYLRVDAHSLVNARINLADIDSQFDRTLRNLLVQGTSLDAAVAAVRDSPHLPTSLPGIVSGLRSTARIADVASQAGFSTRQLQRNAQRWFGYSPKHLHKIFRFQQAISALDSGCAVAEACADAGYADTPHFYRDRRVLLQGGI